MFVVGLVIPSIIDLLEICGYNQPMEVTSLITSPFGMGEPLILALLKRGESVYTVFPSPKSVPMSFLGKINLKYGFVQLDRDIDLDKALPRKVENVYHLYEEQSAPYGKMFRANTATTLSLLEWAQKHSAKNFIYLSSGDIYGRGSQVNEQGALKPQTFYATTKFEAEFLFRFYVKALNIKTVRVFFPFGKNLNHGHVWDLCQAIKKGSGIQFHYQQISPTYTADVVGPVVKLCSVKDEHVFNISGSSIAVPDLIMRIGQICAGSSNKVKIGTSELTGDSTRARSALGYQETTLNDALQQSFGA